jgi:hypothetical protein
MKEFIAKYQKAIVGTGAVAVLLICYFQQKELAKLRSENKIEVLGGGDIAKAQTIDSLQKRCDSLQIVADSLYNENFPCQIELGRYEMAYHILLERNPKAAKQYGDIISNETE